MSLYNMMFGVNPLSSLLKAILNIDGEDGKWPSGRFRDVYLEKTEEGVYQIVLYTRNGGGNRHCWCEDTPKWGTPNCKHHLVEELEDEWIEVSPEEAEKYPPEDRGALLISAEPKQRVKTGRMVTTLRYHCDAPNSAECGCPGCIIEHRMKQHPNYIRDYDDDFDCTYASIVFSIPEKYRKRIGEFYDEKQKSPGERFARLIEQLKSDEKDPVIQKATETLKPLLDMIQKSIEETQDDN